MSRRSSKATENGGNSHSAMPSINVPADVNAPVGENVCFSSTIATFKHTPFCSRRSSTAETPQNTIQEDFENRYTVRRPVFSQSNFDRTYKEEDCHCVLKARQLVKRYWLSLMKPKVFFAKLLSFVPFFIILKAFYKKRFLVGDTIAGVTMAIFHIPQGMAYGLLAGLQPINGLYTSFFPPLIYAFTGTSRHLSVGTFSLVSLMMAGPVERLAKNKFPAQTSNNSDSSNVTYEVLTMKGITSRTIDEEMAFRLQVAMCITLFGGLMQLLMGLFHLGFLASYLSDALVSGFTTGSALHIFTSQVSAIFGIKLPRVSGAGNLIRTYINLFKRITKINWATIIISLVCMVSLVVIRDYVNPKLKAKTHVFIPMELVLVVLSTLISYFAAFNTRFNVTIIGDVPAGLCVPTLPSVSLFPELISDIIVISIVVFAISASISKTYATRKGYSVDYNQELVALGSSNVFGSFFRCHMASGAMARCAVLVEVGMQSQIATFISCGLMLIVLLFVGPLFKSVPNCVLSSIIVVSLKGLLMQYQDAINLWKVSIFDFLIWMVAFWGTVLLDVDLGLMLGFVFALFTVIFRTQMPKSRILGRMPYTDIYRDVTNYKEARELPYMKIFRYDGPLYFANAEHFRDMLYQQTGVNPTEILKARLKAEKKRKKSEIIYPVSENRAEAEDRAEGEIVGPDAISALVMSSQSGLDSIQPLTTPPPVEGPSRQVPTEPDNKNSSATGCCDAETQADEVADLERHLSILPHRRVSVACQEWAAGQDTAQGPSSSRGEKKSRRDKSKKKRPMSDWYRFFRNKNKRRSPSQELDLEEVRDDTVYEQTSGNFEEEEAPSPVEFIILDCSSISYIDCVGVRILKEVFQDYKKCELKLYLAQCKAGMRHMFVRAGFYTNVTKDFMFLTVHDAVLAALNEHKDVKRYVQSDTQCATSKLQTSGEVES